MNATRTIALFAAGSLREALGDAARAYEAVSGHTVEMKFGPSGLLKDDIAAGAHADVFASANMAHPQALHDVERSGAVTRFARNRLSALVRPGLPATTATLIDVMLDPAVRLATSTPRVDPSGDYAFEVFRRAEALRPGARAALAAKALQLTGAKDSAVPPAGRVAYGWHLAEGRADIFLTYRTNALAAQKKYPDQQIVDLPPELAVGADYGLAVMEGTSSAARQFAAYLLSAQGQRILAEYGFECASLPSS